MDATATALPGALVRARGRALRALAERLPPWMMFQHGPRTARRLALTFDDGPGPLTPRYLDALDRAGARGTFFVGGRACEAYRDALVDMTRRGHEVASHGFTHTRFPHLARRALEDELARTFALLPDSARRGPRLVRPPHGAVTPRSLVCCVRAGYASAMWSVETFDWCARSRDEVLRTTEPRRLSNGDIVLLHEEREHTLAALPEVLARAADAGFELVTVSELLGASLARGE